MPGVLAPGCTEYEKRLYYQTYDVTPYLREKNELVFAVGDGWFKGKIGSGNTEYFFGTQTKLLAQLVLTYEDGTTEIIGTDDTFSWSNDGSVRYNDLKDGEVYDAAKRAMTSADGTSIFHQYAQKTEYPVIPTASESELIQEHETFPAKLIYSPEGQPILDFGQNLAGYIRFRIHGKAGQKVTLRMFEVLDNGRYSDTTVAGGKNSETSIDQKIEYLCDGTEDVFEPEFFYSGFRYALVEGMDLVNPVDFETVAVYTDMHYGGTFTCSNEKINQFVRNTVWSEKSNFVDVPTDCPQREKSAWTGDAQVFVKTATYFADTAAFYRKWLKDVRDCQREDGRVDNVCPKIRGMEPRDVLNGSSGWADAAVIIPYTMWKMYDDDRFITENYELLHGWKEYAILSANDKSIYEEGNPMKKMVEPYLLPESPYRKYMIESGLHWGEWAEPEDEMSKDPGIYLIKPKQEVTTAYLHYSMTLLEEMLREVGKDEEADQCREYAQGAKAAYQYYFVREDDIDAKKMAPLVRPLALGLLEETAQRNVAARLNEMAVRRDYTVGTGFLSTPFLLSVPEAAREDAVIIYIHGGGLICGDAFSSKGYASMLAGETKIPVYAFSYRLAPENRFPTAVDDCFEAYKTILEKNPGKAIFLIGESGGGYLGIVTAMKARDNQIKMPTGVIPYSPVTDLSGDLNRDRESVNDFTVTQEALVSWLAGMYCEKEEVRNPYVSPYFDDMHDMPPMLLAWDESETLAVDSEVLVEKLKKNGIECRWKSYPDCFHAFATTGRGTPESMEVLQDTKAFIEEHIKA